MVAVVMQRNYCGLAIGLFATVSRHCTYNGSGYRHELGHVMGASHNKEVSPNGHGYLIKGTDMRTIMA